MLLAREFGWTLDEMRRLRPSELAAILAELQRQQMLQEYNDMRNKWAFLAAVITNAVGALAGMFGKKRPRTVQPDAFISQDMKQAVENMTKKDPAETDRWASYVREAKEKGLTGPW